MDDLHSVLSVNATQHEWHALCTVPEHSAPEHLLTDSSHFLTVKQAQKEDNKWDVCNKVAAGLVWTKTLSV